MHLLQMLEETLQVSLFADSVECFFGKTKLSEGVRRCWKVVEQTDTGWLVVLEKQGLHQAADILENYGIDSIVYTTSPGE